jgi:hypothetical protein
VITGELVATGPFDGIVSTISGGFYTHAGGDRGNRSSLTLRAAGTRVQAGASVRVSGRLSPARRNAVVWIGTRHALGTRWSQTAVLTDRDGAFHATVKVPVSEYVVAQWEGYGTTAGAGSRALLVRAAG